MAGAVGGLVFEFSACYFSVRFGRVSFVFYTFQVANSINVAGESPIVFSDVLFFSFLVCEMFE